ncbi:MAG TPA: hypothetical protein VJ824_07380 [Bacillota bacterium]|nr:hypothetical protein [Bacillota bacterium]
MVFKNTSAKAHREGYRQGLMTALLVSSPFIVAGVKWMMENSGTMVKQMKNVTDTDLYTQFFDKPRHEEKTAARQLDNMRANEGNYTMEASNGEDEQLFKMIKEITKSELANKGKPQ